MNLNSCLNQLWFWWFLQYCKGVLKKSTFYSAIISKIVYFGKNIVKKYRKKYRYRHIDTFSDTVSVSVLIHFVKKYLYRHIDTFQKYRLKVCTGLCKEEICLSGYSIDTTCMNINPYLWCKVITFMQEIQFWLYQFKP